MTWQVLHLEDAFPSPWKNGGGTTRELVAWPGADDWIWRMSVAEVTQSGPFSRFQGIERWFAVLEGDGVSLAIEGEAHRLTSNSAPFRFDGGQGTDCDLLGGPTRDFNLMVRSDAVAATMIRLQGELKLPVNATEFIAIYSISTGTLARLSSDFVDCSPSSLVWQLVEDPGILEVCADQALVIRIAQFGAVQVSDTHPAKDTP